MNRGRSAYKTSSKNGDMLSEVRSRRNKGSTLIGNNGTRSTHGLTKGPDLGNPRYKADKAPSEVGLLIGTINQKKEGVPHIVLLFQNGLFKNKVCF